MTDSFGLHALHEDQRREKLERAYHKGFVVTLSLISLMAAVMIGYHSALPQRPDFVPENLNVTWGLDHFENCLVVRFLNDEGRERHKNAHCPALAPSGMMAWPLARK